MEYLTSIPQHIEDYGICKVLAVRHEAIHIKHIMTEVFVRKSVNIEPTLSATELDIFGYMEYLTNRMRRVFNFPRDFRGDVNEIVKQDRGKFFPAVLLYQGMKNAIILDFDGVVTSNKFNELYHLCVSRCRTIICTANPTVTFDWFDKRGYERPNRIEACKGKKAKVRRLMMLMKQYDNCFYVDNETEYLDHAWLLGIKTFLWANGKISNHSLGDEKSRQPKKNNLANPMKGL